MFDFGKSLINMNSEEQKKMLDNSTPAQKRTAREMGIGFKQSEQQQGQQKRDGYTDLDRLNHVTNKENKAYDFFGKGLESWKQGVTGKNSYGDAGQLKKQFDDHENALLADLPKGGKRHGVLSGTLPKIKNTFLEQGQQFALAKLNERSRSVLDKGLQRIADSSFGAKGDEDIQAHDDQAYDLINKYVMSEAKFDGKDADAMYDTYLGYAGVEPEGPQEVNGVAAEAIEAEKGLPEAGEITLAAEQQDGEPEQKEGASSAQQTRDMEEITETLPKNSAESGRFLENWEKETGNSVEDVEEHYRQKPGAKPTWMKENLGKSDYYEQRARNFEERNPGKKAPDYYREYGDKYVKRFDKLKPELSEKGQKWLGKAKDLLQFKMESGLRSGEWDESKPEELKKKAYDSHSEAYLEAGLADLTQEDIDKIIKEVDRMDMIAPKALWESAEIEHEIYKKKGFTKAKNAALTGLHHLAPTQEELGNFAKEVFEALPILPPLR